MFDKVKIWKNKTRYTAQTCLFFHEVAKKK